MEGVPIFSTTLEFCYVINLNDIEQIVALTREVSGANSLQSSLRASSFSSSSSELGPPGFITEPGGRGPVSPRCFLVMWASGPCTVFTCLRRELGSVYRLVQPGILHT